MEAGKYVSSAMTHKLSPTTLKILNILNDCRLHSGTEIAESLGISRTAVWKVIKRLEQYNIEIESQHSGYLLKSPLVLIDKNKIEDIIAHPKVKLECFETLTSTNDYLKNHPSLKNLQVCLSEHQSKGRGRLGREWIAPFGRNIYCSLSYTFHKDISELSGLSLVVGILTANLLSSLDEGVRFSLKWPNDLYVNNQKLGGVLIDITGEVHGNCTAVIGVGLNVNMKDLALEGVEQPWTSLEHALGKQLDRNTLSAQLINTIVEGMRVFEEKGMEPFLEQWKQYDLLANQQVSLSHGADTLSGIVTGINHHGYLLLRLPSGEERVFSSGDTTLVK